MNKIRRCLVEIIIVAIAILALAFLLRAERSFSIKGNPRDFSLNIVQRVQAQEITEKPIPVPTQKEIIAYAKKTAKKYGINQTLALYILKRESNYDPTRIGDRGHSFGVAQIFLPAHPEVTQEQAQDYKWSINWMMQQILNGKIGMWSTFVHCHDWFEDCPL